MFSINSKSELSLLLLHLGSQKYSRKYFYFFCLNLPLPHTLCMPACILCILFCLLALFVHVQMHSEGRWSLMCQTHVPISIATSIHSMCPHKQFVLLVFLHPLILCTCPDPLCTCVTLCILDPYMSGL